MSTVNFKCEICGDEMVSNCSSFMKMCSCGDMLLTAADEEGNVRVKRKKKENEIENTNIEQYAKFKYQTEG